ncbi:MAG: hypothetical protein J6T03_02240 [Bacteroidales bacterium]|nr:hypothetical protein [Bacteroidales bacterium]
MKLLPKYRKTIAKGLTVWVSNHYCPTLFGIRGHYESSYKSGQYVECGAPGTGFFVRNSSSHSYKNFCKEERAKLVPQYKNMVKGKEFSFEKEIERVTKAKDENTDPIRDMILESYLNVLPLAKEAEEAERYVNGIKELSHRRHHLTSYQSHVMSGIKSRIARLGHDVRDIQLYIPNLCGEERYQQFAEVAKQFTQVASSHRIWSVRENYEGLEAAFTQVYFDLGIFNFIQAPLMTPMMRDAEGRKIFFYPEFIIRAKDSVDFEVFEMKSLTFLFREVPYDMISNMVIDSYYDVDDSSSSTRLHRRNYEQFGDGLLVNKDTKALNDIEEETKVRERVVGELYVPEMKMRYYVRDVKALRTFVHTLNEYKDKLLADE